MTKPTAYPTLIHRLLAEMEAITPDQVAAAVIMDPIARNEKEIGEPISESLQAMWTLHHLKAERCNEMIKQHSALHENATEDAPIDQVEHDKLLDEIKVLVEEAQMVERMFWRSVREHYQADPKGNGIGLRAGWIIVDIYGGKRRGLFETLFGDLFD